MQLSRCLELSERLPQVVHTALKRLARNGDVEGLRSQRRLFDAFNGLDPERRQSAMRSYAAAEALCEARAPYRLVKPKPIHAKRAQKTSWSDPVMRAKLANAYDRPAPAAGPLCGISFIGVRCLGNQLTPHRAGQEIRAPTPHRRPDFRHAPIPKARLRDVADGSTPDAISASAATSQAGFAAFGRASSAAAVTATAAPARTSRRLSDSTSHLRLAPHHTDWLAAHLPMAYAGFTRLRLACRQGTITSTSGPGIPRSRKKDPRRAANRVLFL